MLAAGVAAIPLIQGPNGAGELTGPALVPRPVVIALLLGMPAVLAVLGAYHRTRLLLFAAGVLCALQSIVAFSGVTLVFLLPGILLIGAGLEPMGSTSLWPGRRGWVAVVLVISLGIGAWVVPFVTSETVCWVARPGPVGQPIYTRIPVSDTLHVGIGEIGSGCAGGTFTLEGLLVGGVLGIGALAMAGLATRRPRDPETALG